MNRNFYFKLVSVAIILGMLLVACSGATSDGEPDYYEEPEPAEEPLTLAEPIEGPGDRIIQARDLLILTPDLVSKMEPIENNTITAAQLESVGGVIRFSGIDENLLQVGQVINAAHSPETPDGLLRIVESVQTQDGLVVAQTRQATLEEAIQDGYFDVSYSEFPEVTNQIGGGKLARVASNPAPITRPVNVVIYEDGSGGQVTVYGEITVTPDFDLSVEIADLKMQRFKFVNKTTVKADLTISAGIEYSIYEEKEAFRIPLSTLSVPVKGMKIPVTGDPMVVVLQPELIVTIGLDGQVFAGFEMGGVYTNTVDTSATWTKENEDWEFSKSSNPKFTFRPPTFKTTAYAKVFTKPRIQLMLFGIVGPYVQIDGYFRLDVSPQNPQSIPWWTLKVGLVGEIGIRFELFDFIRVKPVTEPITIIDEIIRQAELEVPPETEPPPPEPTDPPPPEPTEPPPPPPPPAGTGNENIRIVYNNNFAYVMSITQGSVWVKGLEFKRIDNQGNQTASFQSQIWENIYSGYNPIQPGYCPKVGLMNSPDPTDCTVSVNRGTSQAQYHFWIETSTSKQFQVLQNGMLLQTCQISAGSCDVYVPQP